MKNLLGQLSSLFGAGIAAACCLGIAPVLALVGTLGLGFLARDAWLFPLFVSFAALSLWLLYRSTRTHGRRGPFRLGLPGGLVASTALWALVTGVLPLPWLLYTGLGLLMAGSLWDLVNGWRTAACATEACATPPPGDGPADPGRRLATGAALSAGAALAFYGMYKSVDAWVQTAGEAEIACWGVNQCKGTTACSTTFNACNGQNACRGKGFVFASERECALRGGVPLEGSEGDPAHG